jgi:hypothetical protein
MMGNVHTPQEEDITVILADPGKYAKRKAELERLAQEGMEHHDAARRVRAALEEAKKSFEEAKRKAAAEAMAAAEANTAEKLRLEGLVSGIVSDRALLDAAQRAHNAKAADQDMLASAKLAELEYRERQIAEREQRIADRQQRVDTLMAEYNQRIERLRAAMG